MAFILSIFAIFIVLVFSEYGGRKKWLKGELGRKFVHITVGSFVASWPYFLSWNEIRLASVAFLIVVAVSQYFGIFKVIHSVQRPTYGELFFAAVVGLLTFVTQSKGIYTAALLQMSLADGFAAVVGTQYGRASQYKVLGHTKSIIGTMTFFVVSWTILLSYNEFGAHGLAIGLVAFGTIVATALENLGSLGFDNLMVPLFVAALLNRL